MNWHKLAIQILGALFFFMTIGAIFSHAMSHTAPLAGKGSAMYLFIAGALLLLTSTVQDRKRLLFIGGAGYCAEIIGVKGGWLFGQYVYTEILAPSIFGVPLAMICAWFLLLDFVKRFLAPFRLSILANALLVGFLMMTIDLVLDPIAANAFNFWNWNDSGAYYGIPLKNFVGWFVVSFVISVFEQYTFRHQISDNWWSRIIGLSILSMYTICAFIYGCFIAGVIGITLLIIFILLMLQVGREFYRYFQVSKINIKFP